MDTLFLAFHDEMEKIAKLPRFARNFRLDPELLEQGLYKLRGPGADSLSSNAKYTITGDLMRRRAGKMPPGAARQKLLEDSKIYSPYSYSGYRDSSLEAIKRRAKESLDRIKSSGPDSYLAQRDVPYRAQRGRYLSSKPLTRLKGI